MNRMFIVLIMAACVFAWDDDGVFIPDQMADTTAADTLFSVELLGQEEPVSEETISFTETAVEPVSGENEIRPEILLSIDLATQMLVCDFLENDNGKIIQIVTLSGDSVFEILASADEKSVGLSLKKLESGVYIVRILSPETRRSIFSKAIVVG